MPTKRLPASADLAHLKHQAKDLRRACRAMDLAACQRIREFHPRRSGMSDAEIAAQTFTLGDALLSIAREYGYASWPRLKEVVAQAHGEDSALTHNERIPDQAFRQAVALLDEGNEALLQAHLAAHPDLVHQQVTFEGDNYFTRPRLIEFVAENPTRQEELPANIVAIAQIILRAGAGAHPASIRSALGLVASGRVARECGVQLALIDLFCSYGADPASAMQAALGHGEFAAVKHLIRCGAPLDLAAAAALGQSQEVAALLPCASKAALQMALSLAALHGEAKAAVQLLRAGADPNRFNPEGAHAHCTPLHSAALAGHVQTVRALIEGGARRDLRDIHHQATALDWARHAGQAEVVAVLR